MYGDSQKNILLQYILYNVRTGHRCTDNNHGQLNNNNCTQCTSISTCTYTRAVCTQSKLDR